MFDRIRRLFSGSRSIAVPPELASTCRMLRGAYPEGVPDAEYGALLYLLADKMSQRQEATAIEVAFGLDYDRVYNDVLGISAPRPEVLEQVKRRLRPWGYDAWLAEP